MEAIIQVMESAIAAKDPYTVYHQRRATRIAIAIAQLMGVSQKKIEDLRIAGSLHDLGKIAVPSEILYKPGRLTDLEFAILKTHPQVGFNILKPLKIPGQVQQILLQHHERINGSGYPYGLTSNEILLEAKILAVADVVEAISFHRPYRPSLGIEKAIEEMENNRGILYDAEVVDGLVRLYQEVPSVLTIETSYLPWKPVAPLDSLPGKETQMLPSLSLKAKVGRWNWQNPRGNRPKVFLHFLASLFLGGCIYCLSRLI